MSALQTASYPLPVEAGSLPARVLKKLFFCFLFFQCSHLSVSLGFSQLGFFSPLFSGPRAPIWPPPHPARQQGEGERITPMEGKCCFSKHPSRGGGSVKQAKVVKFHQGWVTEMVIYLPEPDDWRDWKISDGSAGI